jgi:hypothetical protein
MASYVLAGIIYCICEVYIDDIIVNAKTAKELLSNARRVFNRIRKHKLLYILQTTQISLENETHVTTLDKDSLPVPVFLY